MDLDKIYEKSIIMLCRISKKGKLYKFFALVVNAVLRLFFSCDISVFCSLGKVQIPHAIGIVVGPTAKIGDGTVIMSNVCVGSTFSDCEDANHKYAVIGKNCVLGANTSIIGNVNIGDNCLIGAGAVITKDIPANSVVVGNNHIIRQVKLKDGQTNFNC